MWLPRGREWEGDGVGSLGLADETGISGMNKQQGGKQSRRQRGEKHPLLSNKNQ